MRARISPEDLPPVPPPVRATLAETLPPDNLDSEHLDILNLAISNLLRTKLAEFTLAQIVDGLPTCSSFAQFHYGAPDGHPAIEHENLCPGALEKVREFRLAFHVTSLRFSPALLQGYQDAQPNTRAFCLRLVEMLAVAFHQIAAFLYGLDEENEHRKAYEVWAVEQHRLKAAGDERYRFYEEAEPPTAFYHRSYRDHEQYPRAVADLVGYWAESKIFGGVVLFDRGESETECKEIWIDPANLPGPRTMYPPTADQLDKLIQFLLSSSCATVECPLPIMASKLNRPRYYRYHATKYFHIFRDKYDSRLPEWFVRPGGCVIYPIDFPEVEDENIIMLQVMWADGTPPDEDVIAAARERLKVITPSSPCWPHDDKRYI
ncbi:hypothetical protein F5B22DRAFT_597948 [Xylaria bambusicola]|uniref:uncharacterized protein n=1 Tax=Xylaria bambusicola TaxID=326684 RepID=UPI002007738C|nr:uncharacterized protein F5B22DRAFT_597948 [Xylaria bambusicola]KAI0521166.1 hypothetical protein F5B22DRAFT_597948 [Xylaria bambusicola]